MRCLVSGLLVLAFTLGITAAQEKDTQKPATPAEQYKALLKEHQAASGGGVFTDEQRMQFIGQVFKRRYQLAEKLLALAERYPDDPIAFDALSQAVWQVNTTPWPAELVGTDTVSARALARLQRDHMQSEKLGPICERVSYGFCKVYESFLRAVLANSPHKPVRAQACLGLAHFLNNRLLRLDLVKGQPEPTKEFADLYGKDYLAELERQDRTQAGKAAEALFEKAAAEYGEVKLPDGGTVAEKARAELFGIRHLSVGQQAPDIAGQDQDGHHFKLSDYRGKVVLLDFWHQQ